MDSFQSRVTALSTSALEKVHHVLNFRCIVGGGEQIFLLALGVSVCTRGMHSNTTQVFKCQLGVASQGSGLASLETVGGKG